MAWDSGVTVEIISNNQSLPLYPDPDAADKEDTGASVRYLEAVTGAKFEIRVALERDFRWGPCDCVRVIVKYDGEKLGWSKSIYRKKGRRSSTTFANFHTWCPASHQWKNGDLSFGALETKEQVDTKADLSRVANLGKIELSVGRVTCVGTDPNREAIKPDPVPEVSEKMLKGKAITMTVESTDSRPCPPPMVSRATEPLSGPGGDPLVYTILYRTRRTLQMLGCITRTPSPESEGIEEGRANVGNAAREREIQDLRARLALLERNGRVKAEPSSGAAGIKHERGDVEVVSARKRSRRSGVAEVVDLTSD